MAYDKDPTRVTRQSKQLQGVMQCYLYKIYTDSTVKRTKLLKHLPVDELRFVVSLLIGRWVRSSYSKKEKKKQQHQKLWSSCACATWSICDQLMRVCCYFNEPPALRSTELFSNPKHDAAKLASGSPTVRPAWPNFVRSQRSTDTCNDCDATLAALTSVHMQCGGWF